MRLVFVISAAVALIIDFSYHLLVGSSQLVESALAVAGVGLLVLGLIQKRGTSFQDQPIRPIYHSISRTAVHRISSDPKAEGSKILRTVPDENAFYFYKMLHYYLDVRAKNLSEFFEKLKTIDVDSITFHASRGDFREWFRTTLGDDNLARKVSALTERSSGEEIRSKLSDMVQTRISSLVTI